MSNVLFNSSELALASHDALSNAATQFDKNIAALRIAGMSAGQAEEFAKRYPTAVQQFNDGFSFYTTLCGRCARLGG